MQPERQLLVLNEYLDATLREIRESPHLRKVLDPLRLDKEPIRFQNGHIHDVSTQLYEICLPFFYFLS